MIDSESFRPIAPSADYSGRYTDVELIRTTPHARLYRMRRAGRLFIAKAAADDSARSIELLKREYELTIGITHPNIVHIYTYETDTPVGAAIVMEYVDGSTLTEYLAGEPSLQERQRIFEQLLSATDYLHKAGVLHNDLKPDNILITRKNHDVRLIDFGFADDDSHYMERMLGGTQGYASPELASRKENIDARSDVYAIGCIMQQLFPGRYGRIARRCLHANPAKRYTNVDSLARAWQRRRRPLQLAGVFIITIMILLPTLLYMNERAERTRYTSAIERERQLCDSLFQVIDTAYEAQYLLTLDSINAIVSEYPYTDAFTMIAHFHERTNKIKEEVLSSATDKAMQSQLSSYIDRTYTTRQTQLIEAAGKWYSVQYDK